MQILVLLKIESANTDVIKDRKRKCQCYWGKWTYILGFNRRRRMLINRARVQVLVLLKIAGVNTGVRSQWQIWLLTADILHCENHSTALHISQHLDVSFFYHIFARKTSKCRPFGGAMYIEIETFYNMMTKWKKEVKSS